MFAQEEHKNHGAWSYCLPRLQTSVGGYDRRFHYVGRDVSKEIILNNYYCDSTVEISLLRSHRSIQSYYLFQVAPSPATGSKAMHNKEFKAYMSEAMAL